MVNRCKSCDLRAINGLGTCLMLQKGVPYYAETGLVAHVWRLMEMPAFA